jgi:hypothetical protein
MSKVESYIDYSYDGCVYGCYIVDHFTNTELTELIPLTRNWYKAPTVAFSSRWTRKPSIFISCTDHTEEAQSLRHVPSLSYISW